MYPNLRRLLHGRNGANFYIILNNSNPTIYRKLKITIKVSSCNIDYWEILEMRIE